MPASVTLTQRSTTEIFEVSPGNETVVEIIVTGVEESEKSLILTPPTDQNVVSVHCMIILKAHLNNFKNN